MAIKPIMVGWHLSQEAHEDLRRDRRDWGEEAYAQQCSAMKEYLCHYFSSHADCDVKFGTIARLGSSADGGKVLKMRWLRPGSGKRGGYRLTIVAYCDVRKVVLCRAEIRADVDGDADVAAATALAKRTYHRRPKTD